MQNRTLPSVYTLMQTAAMKHPNEASEHPDEAFVFSLSNCDATKGDLFRTGLRAPLEKQTFAEPAFTKEGHGSPEVRDGLTDHSLRHASSPPSMYWF